MKTVLAVTSDKDDSTFVPLADAIAARGGRLVRFDTEGFPTHAGLSMELGASGWDATLTLEDGEVLPLDAVHAVWMRRVLPGRRLPKDDLGRSVAMACYREALATLVGLMDSLQVKVVDPPHRVLRGENKTLQLATARRIGLKTPDSLLTNLPHQVRRFHAHHGPLITKLLDFEPLKVRGGQVTVPTSAVREEDLRELDGLSLAPGLFQGRVSKAMEVRALVIGDRVVTAGFPSHKFTQDAVDWGLQPELLEQFEPVTLPAEVEARLVAFARQMGLMYGGADLILTPDGEWVFLEMNPCGEWGWIQQTTPLDPAGALADFLLE